MLASGGDASAIFLLKDIDGCHLGVGQIRSVCGDACCYTSGRVDPRSVSDLDAHHFLRTMEGWTLFDGTGTNLFPYIEHQHPGCLPYRGTLTSMMCSL